ncbi:iron ABC transporter permease [Haloferax mediterranei ATCC 33500]|uniref:Iron ABC transporter permease n=1 Tax=Haloferax mediterranei (strain ATCC 33500 / DSM 1411 / JCM 8866 / NBRC 14739 / NCIMB 2177 / R-4) TaxID=523841 RepID=I3R0K4_HALMT|nr:iron ABC transporter permease [Haloferax mediterranei]AFK17764.1 thiamine ABC transporter permease [Haloferax mediterranei ATCC 33500]AHZ22804.1 sulfate ABC transporter permease [Haloferax mediterranei ATCC 33500]EMA02964.1 thiamine ABC transporter permease [Haloferax mediterranei ATCC 33500]MDX5987853.1 iron ABC transporter permease [Haloferax mediterranei ATCC 33500]QCQ74329.1 iron ABC transporter permease [Haloferax mediterranei ATCC 33500]
MSGIPARRVTRLLEQRLLSVVAAATAVILLVLFYYPVATVFADAVLEEGGFTLDPIISILTNEFYLVDIIWFTAKQAFYSTIASLALGLPAAWLFSRFEFPGRETLRSLTILPFVMPSIMVAIGFVATFGRNGTLNRALSVVGLPPVELLFTLEAIIVAHAFYNAPLVARIVTAAWESVDARTVETARSLGANPRRAFRDVVLPQLLPSVGIGATLTFIFTFASFPIVLALGGFQLATIEVFVYSKVRDLAYAEAASLAVIETVISLTLTAVYLWYEANQRAAGGAASPLPRQSVLPADWTPKAALRTVGIAGYGIIIGLVFIVPIASMVLASVTGGDGGFTLSHYAFLVERQATGASFQVKPLPAIWNSLVFAAGTLLVAVPMGVTMAILTTRQYRGRGLINVLSMAPFAVSGIVVGLGLLRGLVFGVDVFGTRIRVTGTLAIIAAHSVGAYPFVTRNVAPLFSRLDGRLVESARSLGATRTRALLDIELPLVWTGVVAGAAFAVAISIGEFDSTIILAEGSGSYTMPVAVERFLGRRLGPATAMGCVLLVVTSMSFVVIDRFGGRGEL